MQLTAAFKAAEKAIHRVSRGLRWISMGTLFVMIFLVTAGVIARYLLHKPIKGDMEIQELMMVLVVFLAFPFCQLEKGNVYVELLTDRLKGRPKAILGSLSYLLGMIIISLLVWQTGLKAVHSLAFMRIYVTLSLSIPIGPFVLLADIGLALFGIEWLIELIHRFQRALSTEQAPIRSGT